ncbi:hypothetical protein R1flu_012738 [Riccia fluitans]|uniref:Uncharacterized protein n=1 Tax=Riccia fluitans TaxID=41844 RepID=A0ABD1ZBT5_9MARC
MRQLLAHPENFEDRISLQLIEAALSGDEQAVHEALEHELIDVNYRGIVNLRLKSTDTIQREEVADEVQIEYQEFRTDITPLFAAAHVGHLGITKKLLSVGGDVNQKLFRGFATTAASREGHDKVLDHLLRAGAHQEAVEDALLEACLYGHVKAAELLIGSEMTRPEVLAQALVHASSRGFVDVVATLIKNGVDINSWYRILLRSVKPMLYANVDCTPLIAAIVGRQNLVVDYLLEAGAKTGCKASLGAWSWDSDSGEELRVGAGLGEPYDEAWCAVEYWESTGHILRSLLKHLSPDTVHNGRTLICHAILCRNMAALQLILDAGADPEILMQARDGQERPLHYAARSGWLPALKVLIEHGSSVDTTTESNDTPLMICAKYKYWDCFEELLAAGADLGMQNSSGQNAISIAEGNGYGTGLQKIIWDAVVKGKVTCTDPEVFSALHLAAKAGDLKVLQKLVGQVDVNINVQDRYGYTAAMVAVREGHIDAFKLLLYAGADIGMKSKKGETAVALARIDTLEQLEWILLDAILANILKSEGFQVLHFAARRGHLEVLTQLLKRGYALNGWDEDGYTPLMLSAREGHADACKLLLLAGADTALTNDRGETALSLAQKHSTSKAAENTILDYLAKKYVLAGAQVLKYKRQGRGKPHEKSLSMLKTGVLSWGSSRKRNVVCTEATLGPSAKFRRNRHRKGDADKLSIFRIVTFKGKEVHFEASTPDNAELWVRGINLLSAEVRAQVSNGSVKGVGE